MTKSKKVYRFFAFFMFIVVFSLCCAAPSFAKVTQEQAYQIALKHAGVSASQATLLKQKIDHEFSGDTYEIEFLAGETKYEYDIFVGSGKIKKFKSKRADREDLEDAQRKKSFQAETGKKQITKAEAESIAFKDLGTTRSKVHFLTTQLETDDGMTYYKVKFLSGMNKHKYKIDASTGRIIEHDD